MMIEGGTVQEFPGQRRLALVGSSNNPKSFSNTIYRELRRHGYEVVPVDPSAVELLELCQQNGVNVVAGACPLMFLEPVGWVHRGHPAIRHMNGSLAKGS